MKNISEPIEKAAMDIPGPGPANAPEVMAATRLDPRLIIERVPGGFILSEDWGQQRSVCASVPKVVAAVRARFKAE